MRYAVVRLLSSHALSQQTLNSLEQFLSHAEQQYRKQFSFKFINLIDPCFSSNNLGKSISLFNSHRFKEALKLQHAFNQKVRLDALTCFTDRSTD